MKYHVHVYETRYMEEYDIEAQSEGDARAQAIELADRYPLGIEPDCRYIAIIPVGQMEEA